MRTVVAAREIEKSQEQEKWLSTVILNLLTLVFQIPEMRDMQNANGYLNEEAGYRRKGNSSNFPNFLSLGKSQNSRIQFSLFISTRMTCTFVIPQDRT